MKAFPWILAGVGVGLAVVILAMNEPETQAETGWNSVEDAADRSWRFGSKARLSGLGSSVKGRVKEGLGQALGDQDLADEGAGEQAVGAVKDAAGKVAHAVGETIHDLNR